MNLKRSIFWIGIIFISIGAQAENLLSKTSVNTSLDIVSRHLWRGYNSGTEPTLGSTLEIQSGKFTIGTWGAYSIDES
ncbi:hypothetical protein [Ancylomarina longa]|uniref:Uncharacterized protein n=1 Tax=Ancylomarina longa TaxID=2487017 RepID=A0A434AGL0_9BACT|nr:hypothetical protein [Ancylomarina longa]RUT73463.1 hypothetical protein DLK05_13360 [Ancylomarina longa]